MHSGRAYPAASTNAPRQEILLEVRAFVFPHRGKCGEGVIERRFDGLPCLFRIDLPHPGVEDARLAQVIGCGGKHLLPDGAAEFDRVLRGIGGLRIVFYGIFLVVFIVALPEGIFHYIQRKYHQFERWVEVQ